MLVGFLERLLQRQVDGAQHLDPCPAFVVGLHQRPGRDFGAGAVNHVADGRTVVVPLVAVAPVVFGDLEALERDFLTGLEAFQLGLLVDGQPELDHNHAGVAQLLFEVINLAIGTHPVGRRAEAFDAFHQDAAVPGAVEHREHAARRDLLPEAPQVRLRALVFTGRGNRHDMVLTRVQRRRHPADRTALARRIVAFKHRDQRVFAHALVAHQAGQPRLFGDQLFFVIVLFQVLAQVEAVEQAFLVYRRDQRCRVHAAGLALGQFQSVLHTLQQQLAHGETTVVGVNPFNHIPRRIVAAGTAQDALAEVHKLVVGLGLLPVQRADAPTVQRVIGQGLEPRLHLLLGEVEPELEDQRAFIAEHFFQALGTGDGLVEPRVLDLAMHATLQHLAVPVAKKDPHAAFRRQLAPIAPSRRAGQFFVGLLVEGAYFDQARVHPFIQQLDGFALAAILSGYFSMEQAIGQFFLAAGMGVIVGLVIAHIVYVVHRFLPTTPSIDAALTLMTPYFMYMAAEHFHFSGVMAVVAGGLFLSYRSHEILSHSASRIQAISVWATLAFVLNGLVFILIGLELPVIMENLGNYSITQAINYGLIISITIIIIRLLYTLLITYIPTWLGNTKGADPVNPLWKGAVIVGWAGMRGVVSLASALSIPLLLSNGEAFPHRSLILFITFIVILVTLVFQGLTLPLVIKWIGIKDIEDFPPEGEQEAGIRLRLMQAALKRLNEKFSADMKENELIGFLKKQLESDISITSQQLESLECDSTKIEEIARYNSVLIDLYSVQRKELYQLRKEKTFSDEQIRKQESQLDLDEAKIL